MQVPITVTSVSLLQHFNAVKDSNAILGSKNMQSKKRIQFLNISASKGEEVEFSADENIMLQVMVITGVISWPHALRYTNTNIISESGVPVGGG